MRVHSDEVTAARLLDTDVERRSLKTVGVRQETDT